MWFGFTGIFLIQGSFIPQIVKLYQCYKYKRLPIGVSEPSYWVLIIGMSCYLIYSIGIKDPVYITSNTIGLVMMVTALTLLRKAKNLFRTKHLRYGKQSPLG